MRTFDIHWTFWTNPNHINYLLITYIVQHLLKCDFFLDTISQPTRTQCTVCWSCILQGYNENAVCSMHSIALNSYLGLDLVTYQVCTRNLGFRFWKMTIILLHIRNYSTAHNKEITPLISFW